MSRFEHDLSQNDVALGAGLTQACISNYENGKRDPKLGDLVKVAGALGEVPDTLVTRIMWYYRHENERQIAHEKAKAALRKRFGRGNYS